MLLSLVVVVLLVVSDDIVPSVSSCASTSSLDRIRIRTRRRPRCPLGLSNTSGSLYPSELLLLLQAAGIGELDGFITLCVCFALIVCWAFTIVVFRMNVGLCIRVVLSKSNR